MPCLSAIRTTARARRGELVVDAAILLVFGTLLLCSCVFPTIAYSSTLSSSSSSSSSPSRIRISVDNNLSDTRALATGTTTTPRGSSSLDSSLACFCQSDVPKEDLKRDHAEDSSPLLLTRSTTCANCVFGPQGDYTNGVLITFLSSGAIDEPSLNITFTNCTFSNNIGLPNNNTNTDLIAPVTIRGTPTSVDLQRDYQRDEYREYQEEDGLVNQLNLRFDGCEFANNTGVYAVVAMTGFNNTIYNASIDALFNDCRFSHNTVIDNGAAVLFNDFLLSDSNSRYGSIEFRNCSFTNNSQSTTTADNNRDSINGKSEGAEDSSFASAIKLQWVFMRSLLIDSCSFERNEGGALALHASMLSETNITRSVFAHNSAPIFGGAICIEYSFNSLLVVQDSLFEYNIVLPSPDHHRQQHNNNNNRREGGEAENQDGSVVGSGGAIALVNNANSAPMMIQSCTFRYNEGYSRGGAVFAIESLVSVHNSTFESNKAILGGVFHVASSSPAVALNATSSRFDSNDAMTGGSVYIESGKFSFRSVKFESSVAVASGGALFVSGSGQGVISNGRFYRCAVYESQCAYPCSGGAMYLSGSLTCHNCSFEENKVLGLYVSGNGAISIFVGSSGSFRCESCLFANNWRSRNGEQELHCVISAAPNSATVHIIDSVFHNNTGSLGTAPPIYNQPYNSNETLVIVTRSSFFMRNFSAASPYATLETDSLAFSSGVVQMIQCLFRGNIVITNDGASLEFASSQLSLRYDEYNGFYGALYISSGPFKIADSVYAPDVDSVDEPTKNQTSLALLVLLSQDSTSFSNTTIRNAKVVHVGLHNNEIHATTFDGCDVSFTNSHHLIISYSAFTGGSLLVVNGSDLAILHSTFDDDEDTTGYFIAERSTLKIEGDVLSVPLQLQDHCTLSISNSSFILHNVNDIECLGDGNTIKGELSEYRIDPACTDFEFKAISITRSVSRLEIIQNPSGDAYFNIEINPRVSGVFITVEPNSSDSNNNDHQNTNIEQQRQIPSPIEDFTNLYLFATSCENAVTTKQPLNYIINTTLLWMPATIGFDGPTPDFFHPRLDATLQYCLLVNYTVDVDSFLLSIQFIDRKLSHTSIEFVGGGDIRFYTKDIAIQYSLSDQWGDLYPMSETLNFSSPQCATGICGSTYPGLAAGQKVLTFDIAPNWRLWTKVDVSLPLQPQPAVFYVLSLNIQLVVLGCIAGLLVGVKVFRRISDWRKRIKLDRMLLVEKEKEIQELKELWNIDPAAIQWEERLASGGFGEVWRCKLGETTVAVKKLLRHWLESDSSTADEFKCEVEVLKKLRHSNIVLFFGAGQSPSDLTSKF
eukprot:TRINITY_DN911_c0_g1_i1.p1 TRINITY_DN911_c0_g1~~TRINITY_DN911_c0_g1_i1.p1  ORF type:complete len:1329 (-),score=324.89 TRINITY_DN911_c0_g1_i1:796-4782(-)